MIKSYKLKQHANKGKQKEIFSIRKEYRKSATLLAKEQWILFNKTKKFDKNFKSNIESNLSARYVQTCQYQIVSILKSFLSNKKNDFNDYVIHSSLD